MWTVVYIAKNTQIAEQLRTLLEDGGMLVKIRPISKSEENADPSCEVWCRSPKSSRRTAL